MNELSIYEKIVKKWRENEISSVAELDQHLHNFRILFAYNSGKIENEEVNYHDTRELFENGRVSGFTGDPRAIFEQQNQKICYDFLKEKIILKESLSSELIREVHGILTAGCYDERRFIELGERPGQFKKHDYVTGIHEVGYPPDKVKEEMDELAQEVNAYKGSDLLKAGAYFHLKFEHIHPFADGNGRTGRTMLNFYLMTKNHPPLIIYEEDKMRYFSALEKYDSQEDISCMYDFLKQQIEKTWEKSMNREIYHGNGTKLQEFEQKQVISRRRKFNNDLGR